MAEAHCTVAAVFLPADKVSSSGWGRSSAELQQVVALHVDVAPAQTATLPLFSLASVQPLKPLHVAAGLQHVATSHVELAPTQLLLLPLPSEEWLQPLKPSHVAATLQQPVRSHVAAVPTHATSLPLCSEL